MYTEYVLGLWSIFVGNRKYLIEQIGGGNLSPKNVWLAESLLSIFVDHKAWLFALPVLVQVTYWDYIIGCNYRSVCRSVRCRFLACTSTLSVVVYDMYRYTTCMLNNYCNITITMFLTKFYVYTDDSVHLPPSYRGSPLYSFVAAKRPRSRFLPRNSQRQVRPLHGHWPRSGQTSPGETK